MDILHRIRLQLHFKGSGLLLLLLLAMVLAPTPASASIQTSADSVDPLIVEQLPSLYEFAAGLPEAPASRVAGIYAPGRFALRVVQQPPTQPGYVSSLPETATQFSAARKYGTLGLLAHNTHAGEYFFLLGEGDIVIVIFGDGRHTRYRIADILRFQALTPTSPYSNFRDLEDPHAPLLTSTALFYETYGVGDQTILQTCIEHEGNPVWGRLFVIAQPVPAYFDLQAAPRPPI